jgi:hypothetical protein
MLKGLTPILLLSVLSQSAPSLGRPNAVPSKTSNEPVPFCLLPKQQVFVHHGLGRLVTDAHPDPADLARGVSAERPYSEGFQHDFLDLLADAGPELPDGVTVIDHTPAGRQENGIRGEKGD